MKTLKEVEVRFSLSVHQVVEVQEDDVDLAEESLSLVSLLISWLRTGISRLFRAKLRDVLNSFGAWFADCLFSACHVSRNYTAIVAWFVLGNYII